MLEVAVKMHASDYKFVISNFEGVSLHFRFFYISCCGKCKRKSLCGEEVKGKTRGGKMEEKIRLIPFENFPYANTIDWKYEYIG